MIDRVEQLRILEPERVFQMAGINDVTISNSGEFKRCYEKLVELLKSQVQKAVVILQLIIPVNDYFFNLVQ